MLVVPRLPSCPAVAGAGAVEGMGAEKDRITMHDCRRLHTEVEV